MMAAEMEKPEFTPMMSKATSLDAPDAAADLRQWLAGSEQDGGERRDAGLDWLLATTYSEVVWGMKVGDVWQLSPKETALPAGRLLELRAFGPDAEIFVWRDAAGLQARLRRDETNKPGDDTYDEEQLLWGTVRLDGAPDGFTGLAEGEQGLVHAPPLKLDAPGRSPAEIPPDLLGGLLGLIEGREEPVWRHGRGLAVAVPLHRRRQY